MPADNRESLPPAEWKIMMIVWKRGSCAARDVYEEAGREYGWAMSTSKTLLRRLMEKGYVKVTRVGSSFLYEPARPALESLLSAADTLLANTMEGMGGALLVHLVKKTTLSQKDVKTLRLLLKKYDSPRRASDGNE
jgi:BlaI family transcriptional regulator, penicillinase repressor